MKNFIFKYFLYFIILIINQISDAITEINRCETNLECLDTGCCHNNECSSSSKCKRVNKICYGLVGGAGFIFIGLAFLSFFFKIKKTRKTVMELKKIDDKFYSKRRNSNADMFRRLRNRQATVNN